MGTILFVLVLFQDNIAEFSVNALFHSKAYCAMNGHSLHK